MLVTALYIEYITWYDVIITAANCDGGNQSILTLVSSAKLLACKYTAPGVSVKTTYITILAI